MNHYDNVSEADFVKWQTDRHMMELIIKSLTVRVSELQDESAYWQREAMKQQGRD